MSHFTSCGKLQFLDQIQVETIINFFAAGQKRKHMSGMQSWYWLSPQNTHLVITFLWLQNLNFLTKKMVGGKLKPKKNSLPKILKCDFDKKKCLKKNKDCYFFFRLLQLDKQHICLNYAIYLIFFYSTINNNNYITVMYVGHLTFQG